MISELTLLSYASGIAANNADTALGPWYFYYHPELFRDLSFDVRWEKILCATSDQRGLKVLPEIEKINRDLAEQVVKTIQAQKKFCTLAGDHSSAIGTWSGVAHAYRAQGDIGLIWVDAHMDSHTPESSETQNIHGMPAAHLMGHGIQALCHLLDTFPKVKPENFCFIGIRSYQAGEEVLLKELGVKIFYMEEVAKIGVREALQQAVQHVSKNTCGFGLTIDLDAFDPNDAPGVGYHEPQGIIAKEFIAALSVLDRTRLLGLEITEYNPIRDVDAKTAKLAVELLKTVYT